MEKKDPPIVEAEFLSGQKVIDFGDIRVARGLTRRTYSGCRHLQLVYDTNERRIWCKDCERDVEAFDAFKGIAQNFQNAYSEIQRQQAQISEARAHNIHLLAAREIERAWRGKTMAVLCPHCRGGLLPEDFARGAALCSGEIEKQRRKAKKKEPTDDRE